MYDRFETVGIDMAEDPVEVAPTAHYAMGGVDIDFDTGATSIDRLYAVGETTAGVHGANRLGGNSLAETVAIGTVVGSYIAPRQSSSLPDGLVTDAENHFATLAALTNADGSEDPREIISDLSEFLWENAGIFRDEERLDDGLAQLDELRERAADLSIDGDRTGEAFEFALDLHFMLPVAEVLLRSAKQRTESRGGHYRTDYDDQDDDWRRDLLCSLDDGDVTVRTRAVGTPSRLVGEAIEEDHELEYQHLE